MVHVVNRWFNRLAVVAAGVVFLQLAPLASADTLGTTGYAKGSQAFDLSIGGNVNAGGFAGTWDSGSIIFWCVELTQYFGFGGNYPDYVASMPDDATFTLLGKLFTEAYGSATTDAAHSAAFQLAIWEIVYDPDLNLSAGDFRVLSGNALTVALAQSWLDNLGKYADSYALVFLHSATHQDFVTFGRPFLYLVPEPPSIALFVLGLLALAIALARARRRYRPSAVQRAFCSSSVRYFDGTA